MCSAIPTLLSSLPSKWWIVPIIGAFVSGAYLYLLRASYIKRLESILHLIGVFTTSVGFLLVLDIANPWQLNLIKWQGSDIDCQKANNVVFSRSINLSNQIEVTGTVLWIGGLFLFVLAPFITAFYTWLKDRNQHIL